jgi:hypothetical protein
VARQIGASVSTLTGVSRDFGLYIRSNISWTRLPVPHQRRLTYMTINLPSDQRYDSRGLPEGYDPHKLYEYRLDTLIKNSSGIESFLYKVMPPSLVKSLAFAVDPTAKYKVSQSAITLANRTKYRNQAHVLSLRQYRKWRDFADWKQTPNYAGAFFCWSPHYVTQGFTDSKQAGPLGGQPVLADRLKDTTSRTRLIGSERGTLELFKGVARSPPRKATTGTSMTGVITGEISDEPRCSELGGIPNRAYGSNEFFTEIHEPSGTVLSSGAHAQLRDGEINFCKASCQSNAISMLKSVSPFQRDYTLGRNLVELRDIPRSIASLMQTAVDLKRVAVSLVRSPKTRKIIFNLKGLAKDVPNEYLSYHFGWKQLYKDIEDLLKLPEKTSKRVNFLIRRNGKPTTLRSTRDIVSGTSLGVSGFEENGLSYEYSRTSASRIERKSQVRLVINALWDFPPINSPEFKRHVYAQRIGLEPRITDVYNLVPWTWLIDWFTGLGNYVELIDDINKDPKLINWGMITCHTEGRLITEISSKSNIVREQRVDASSTSSTKVVDNRHTSFYDFECQTRSDVATILDVKLTSVPSTLTTYQKSILGALIAQRTKLSK